MDKIRLGRTELMVTACSFGALPVQRRSVDDAVKLLRKAYDGGINYFDTANMYTDSEMKLGLALSDVRHDIIISTKSGGKDTKRNSRIPAFEFHDQKNKKGPNVEVHKDPYIKAPNHCF